MASIVPGVLSRYAKDKNAHLFFGVIDQSMVSTRKDCGNVAGTDFVLLTIKDHDPMTGEDIVVFFIRAVLVDANGNAGVEGIIMKEVEPSPFDSRAA
jgi:hypothetical protein